MSTENAKRISKCERIPQQLVNETQIKTEPEEYEEDAESDTEKETKFLGDMYNFLDVGQNSSQVGETSIGIENEEQDVGDGEETKSRIESEPEIKAEPEEFEEVESEAELDTKVSGDMYNYLDGSGKQVYNEENHQMIEDLVKIEPDSEVGTVGVNVSGCDFTYSLVRKNGLLVHTYLVPKPFQCSFKDCIAKFTNEKSLNKHIRQHGKQKQLPRMCTTEKLFPCEYENCGRIFSRKFTLERHGLLHANRKEFECEVEGCGLRFTNKCQLLRHGMVHTSKKKVYVCKFEGCGKRYAQKYRLTVHHMRHTGDKPFQCPVEGCSAGFYEKFVLRKHLTTHNISIEIIKRKDDGLTPWERKLQSMTQEEREEFLRKKREGARLHRALETPEMRERRQSKMAKRRREDCDRLTPERQAQCEDKEGGPVVAGQDGGELGGSRVDFQTETQSKVNDEPVCFASSHNKKDCPVPTSAEPVPHIKEPETHPGEAKNPSGKLKCCFTDCKHTFRDADSLAVHTRKHNDESKSDTWWYIGKHEGEMRFTCDHGTCWQSFKRPGDLTQHKRTHETEEPVKCPMDNCGKDFTKRHIHYHANNANLEVIGPHCMHETRIKMNPSNTTGRWKAILKRKLNS